MLGSTHIAYQLLFSENGSIQTLSYSFEFVVVVGGGCGLHSSFINGSTGVS